MAGSHAGRLDHLDTAESMNANHPRVLPHPGHAQRNPQAVRRSRLIVGILVIFLLSFSLLNVWLNLNQEKPPEEVAGVIQFTALPSSVVEGPVSYDQHPPAGGPHAAFPQLCGLYRYEIPNEHAVASLATGAIWITYRPDLPESEINALRETFQGEYDVIVSPYAAQEAPIVATAWERQLTVEDVRDQRLPLFMLSYRNHERAPNADDNCAHGTSQPAS
jgi:hypothetical protein